MDQDHIGVGHFQHLLSHAMLHLTVAGHKGVMGDTLQANYHYQFLGGKYNISNRNLFLYTPPSNSEYALSPTDRANVPAQPPPLQLPLRWAQAD